MIISRGYAEHFQEWAEKDLKSSLVSHRNHPCIIQWSIGNEILEQRVVESTTALHASEKSYREIFDAATDMIVVHDARTGEVQGERPWSWVKIVLLVAAVVAAGVADPGINSAVVESLLFAAASACSIDSQITAAAPSPSTLPLTPFAYTSLPTHSAAFGMGKASSYRAPTFTITLPSR